MKSWPWFQLKNFRHLRFKVMGSNPSMGMGVQERFKFILSSHDQEPVNFVSPGMPCIWTVWADIRTQPGDKYRLPSPVAKRRCLQQIKHAQHSITVSICTHCPCPPLQPWILYHNASMFCLFVCPDQSCLVFEEQSRWSVPCQPTNRPNTSQTHPGRRQLSPGPEHTNFADDNAEWSLNTHSYHYLHTKPRISQLFWYTVLLRAPGLL